MSSSLSELYLARLREFYRQPARIFWVYGFPMILAVGIGLAFRNPSTPSISLDIVSAATDEDHLAPDLKSLSPDHPLDRLLKTEGTKETASDRILVPARGGRAALSLRFVPREIGTRRVKTGKTPLLVSFGPAAPGTSVAVDYRFDPTRPEGVAARGAFDDALQEANGRSNPIRPRDDRITEPGSRYIDFLIPGLIGQNTMGGGLWGVGFLIVNFRIMKLLKRFAATPMPRRNFLLAILGARLTFLIPDMGVLLALGYFGFGMPIAGQFWLIALIEIVGALAFAGIGLLLAARTKTTESVSGLMNLVMLPQWIFSGLFFSSERFEGPIRIIVDALPLTHLLNALRAVILEGVGIDDRQVWIPLLVLSAWSIVTFVLALKVFRWS